MVMRRNIVEVKEMLNLASIRLLVVACFCGVPIQSFAADEAVQPRGPNSRRVISLGFRQRAFFHLRQAQDP
jgi:hypothetical protein